MTKYNQSQTLLHKNCCHQCTILSKYCIMWTARITKALKEKCVIKFVKKTTTISHRKRIGHSLWLNSGSDFIATDSLPLQRFFTPLVLNLENCKACQTKILHYIHIANKYNYKLSIPGTYFLPKR